MFDGGAERLRVVPRHRSATLALVLASCLGLLVRMLVSSCARVQAVGPVREVEELARHLLHRHANLVEDDCARDPLHLVNQCLHG